MNRELIQDFAEFFHLTRPGTAAAFPLDARTVLLAFERANAAAARVPELDLDAGLLGALADKRSPTLHEILELCAAALEQAPEVQKVCPVTPQRCRDSVARDDATTELVKVTGDLHTQAQDHLRVLSTEANGLGERVLHDVARRLREGDEEVVGTDALEAAFTAALTRLTDALASQRRAEGTAAAAAQPAETSAAAARARIEEEKAIRAILAGQKG